MSIVSDIIQGKANINAELYTAKVQELGFDKQAVGPYFKHYVRWNVTVVFTYIAVEPIPTIKCSLMLKEGDCDNITFVIPQERFIILSEASMDRIVEEYVITQNYHKLYQDSIKHMMRLVS